MKPGTTPVDLHRIPDATRVIGRKLDCLNPNLQEMEVHIRRNDA
jgi:hypothetical protein